MPTLTNNRLGQWDELAEALRGELAEYGGLLALLEEQRQAVVTRDTGILNDVNARAAQQAAEAARLSEAREGVCVRMARACGVGDKTTVRELIGYMPPNARGMFDALIKESADLTTKVTERVRRNSMLVARASEQNERLIMNARPLSTTKAYNKRGGVYIKTGRSGALDLTA